MHDHADDGYEDLNISEDTSMSDDKMVNVEIKGNYSLLRSKNKCETHLHRSTSLPILVSIILSHMEMPQTCIQYHESS